jgi:hypothetical protein
MLSIKIILKITNVKKYFLAISFAVISMLFSGFKIPSPMSKLYPELDNFFKSVKGTSMTDEHKKCLDNLSSFLLSSRVGDKDVNVVYGCYDNGFRSIAAQIFTQTLMGIYKYKKVRVISCGNEKGAGSPELLNMLKAAGYKVEVGQDGITIVKYSDDLSPLFVTISKFDDGNIPTTDFMYIPLCSSGESCPDLPGASFKFALDFQNPGGAGNLSAEFKQIAGEIYYGSNKAYESYH